MHPKITKFLGGQHALTSVLLLLLAYNALCVFGFFTVYSCIDFDKHYQLADGGTNNWSTRLYYSFSVQTTCMCEIYPRNTLGRTLTSLQILSSWVPTLLLIVPWIRATRHRRTA